MFVLKVCINSIVFAPSSGVSSVFHLYLAVQQFSSVLTLSTWREPQTPQVEGSAPQEAPIPFRC